MKRPFYAALLAPTIVLAAYGGTHVSPYHLVRPLVASLLIAVAVLVLTGLARRHRHTTALCSALALLAVAGLWLGFWLLAVAWVFLAWRSMHWQHAGWRVAVSLTRPLNFLTAAWFIVASLTALWVSLPQNVRSPDPVAIEPGPSIYMVLLDAYPRADSLDHYFDFDNSPFLRELERRGFDISQGSTSEYVVTAQVVPTLMQMRPLEDLLGEPWDSSDTQHRRLWQQLNSAPVRAAFEDAGYATFSIVSSAEAVDLRNADVVLESPWLTRFEDYLLNRGILQTVIPFDAMDRAEILDAFRYLRESAGQTPRFVFAHLMSPHDPYVFTADGLPAAPCGLPCANHVGPPNAMLQDRLIGQLKFLNRQVLDAVDHIVSVDPEAIVVLFSDHGLRRDRDDRDEWHRTLFAARNADFADDVSVSAVMSGLIDP